MASFEDLPYDTLVHLFSFLDYDEIHRAGCTNGALKKVAKAAEPVFWSHYEASWGGKDVLAQTAQCLDVPGTSRSSIFTSLSGKSQFEVEIPDVYIADHLSQCLQVNNPYAYHSSALSFVTKRALPLHTIDGQRTLELLQEEFRTAELTERLVENLEIVDFKTCAQAQLQHIVNCSSRPYPADRQLHDYVHGLAGLLGPAAQEINLDEIDLETAKAQLEAIACQDNFTWIFVDRLACAMSGDNCYGYGMVDFFLGLIRPDRHTVIYCMISDSD